MILCIVKNTKYDSAKAEEGMTDKTTLTTNSQLTIKYSGERHLPNKFYWSSCFHCVQNKLWIYDVEILAIPDWRIVAVGIYTLHPTGF